MNDDQFRQAIDAAIRDWPDLTAEGVGAREDQPTFDQDRAELYRDKTEFEAAVAYIKQCGFRKTLNRHETSYGRKHAASDYTRVYTTNGTFIAALHYCGATIAREDEFSPNVLHNLRGAQ